MFLILFLADTGWERYGTYTFASRDAAVLFALSRIGSNWQVVEPCDMETLEIGS